MSHNRGSLRFTAPAHTACQTQSHQITVNPARTHTHTLTKAASETQDDLPEAAPKKPKIVAPRCDHLVGRRWAADIGVRLLVWPCENTAQRRREIVLGIKCITSVWKRSRIVSHHLPVYKRECVCVCTCACACTCASEPRERARAREGEYLKGVKWRGYPSKEH